MSTAPSTLPEPAISNATNDQKDTVPVLLRPRDPLIFRDARPFAAEPGARAFSLSWPLPRTVTGALRTHIVNRAIAGPPDWRNDKGQAAQRAKQIAVRGPLLVARYPANDKWQPYVPAPNDVVAYQQTVTQSSNGETMEVQSPDLSFMCLRPMLDDYAGGCDFPYPDQSGSANGRQQAMAHVDLRPMRVSEEIKPDISGPAFWSLNDAVRWLSTTDANETAVRCALSINRVDGIERLSGIGTLPKETSTHVSIDPTTLTNVEGALFTTEARVFQDRARPRFATESYEDTLGSEYRAQSDTPAIAMLCDVSSTEQWDQGATYLPLGGERRLASIEIDTEYAQWPTPADPPDFRNIKGLRLQIVTPAIFTHGWLPGWMADGVPPGLRGMKTGLKLVGAITGRRVPVSGWRLSSITTGEGKGTFPPGPRETFYAVPAGSVYFFTFTKGTMTEELWNKLWLRPVSDLDIHRSDGFGLVLPGIW